MNKEISDLAIFLTGSLTAITVMYYSTLHAMNKYVGPACLATIDYGVRKSPRFQKLNPDLQPNCEGLSFRDTLRFYHKNYQLDL